MRLLMQIGFVALGSAAGGLARWGVAIAAARWLGATFPYGTLFINVSGSFFLGWFLTALAERVAEDGSAMRADDLRLAIGVGFTGAYTTFSTFEWESHGMLREGHHVAGTAYMACSLLLGLIALRFGVQLARWSVA